MFKLTYPRFVLLLGLIGAILFGIAKALGKTDMPWI